MSERSQWQSIKVEGSQLVDRVKELVHEGNVRRIVIRQGDRVVAEFPLTFGVVGALLAPVFAAVGAIAALVTDCTIDIERTVTAPVDTAVVEPAGDAGEVVDM